MAEDQSSNLNGSADLSKPRVMTAPRVTVGKPASHKFKADDLRLDLSQLESNQTAAPLGIGIRKPKETEWFRVHPDPQFRIKCMLYMYEVPGTNDRELHLVHPNMVQYFSETSAGIYQLFLLTDRVGTVFLTEVRQPGANGKWNEWHRTRQLALEQGITQWVRMRTGVGRYEWFPPRDMIPDPVWPDLTVDDILELAFGERGRIIDTPDHPVLRVLRGEI
jgi:hypothetical protein